MSEIVNVPQITARIEELHSMLNKKNTSKETAKKINDVLIYADKVPIGLISAAWDLFAQRKGLK